MRQYDMALCEGTEIRIQRNGMHWKKWWNAFFGTSNYGDFESFLTYFAILLGVQQSDDSSVLDITGKHGISKGLYSIFVKRFTFSGRFIEG